MKRAFIAIKIDVEQKTLLTIQNIKTKLKNEKIRWVNFENVHLTLKFLGDTEESMILKIYKAIQNSKLVKTPAFKIDIQSIGLFKSIYRPRVIWMGIKPSAYLENIFNELQIVLQDLQIEKEHKKFSPHLTIGRMKYINNTKALQAIINDHKKTLFQETEVQNLIIYESILHESGPVYKELFKINLA